MRDLAKQNFSSSKGFSKRPANAGALRIIMILIVVFGLGFFIKSKFLGSDSASGSSDVILSEAPRGLTPVQIGNGKVAQGEDIKTESAKFRLVKSGFEGKVIANRSLNDGEYFLSVDGTLPDPKSNYSYGVWLVDGEEEELVDYLGGAGTSWYLNASRGKELMNFDTIWITRENSRKDGSEEVLFEGSF